MKQLFENVDDWAQREKEKTHPVTDLSDVQESESVENSQTSDNPLIQNDYRGPENDLSNVRYKKSKKNTQEMTTFEKHLVEMWNSTNNLAFDETWHSSIQSSLKLED
ncbi:unnamed protein product [Parnassius apollo]|uniref:(apollo) hypothetical protein n=1 Tax=Parnassius apollo TaxID=110799 RepID=A0A8S3XKE4_PARAO|nr:unnamed protein product [Parnassius apollo]